MMSGEGSSGYLAILATVERDWVGKGEEDEEESGCQEQWWRWWWR